MQGRDAELIRGYLDGESAATAEIDGWVGAAASPFRRRLSAQWDDVLQDAHVEIIRLLRGGQFRGDSALKTYLWRVVAHSCLDRIRSNQRWRWTELEETVEDPESPRPRGGEPQAADTFDLVGRVLKSMSEECRRIWRLIVEGYSYREMSVSLGSSEGALRVKALRCRRRALEIRASLEGGARSSV